MQRLIFITCFSLFAVVASAADLEISHGWIRLLPAGVPAGGYFEVHNSAKSPAELVGAKSPAFNEVMLHKTAEQEGHSTMMHMHKLLVPAGGKLVFKPGGYHLMLMKPTGELKVGEKIPVTLEFSGGNKITAQFDVRGPSGK